MNNKIMVIDDDREILNDYQSILSAAETAPDEKLSLIAGGLGLEPPRPSGHDKEVYNVVSASCGEDAVNKIKLSVSENDPFAVVFCDMRMPGGMDGLETGKQIRKLDSHVEFVFVTGYSDHARHYLVYEVGNPEKILYLKKPFDPDEIRQLALKLTRSWQMEQDLKGALEMAKAADKAKSEFLALVTHEFKTPLTGIIGSVQTLKGAINRGTIKKSLKFLDMMERSAFRILAMVDEILAFSRAQSTQAQFDPQPFDLKEFLDSLAAEEIYPLMKNKPLRLIMDLPDCSIYADMKKLRHILMNLVSNAVKFTESGAITIKCLINSEGLVDFFVSDTGRGIPASHVERVFDEFYQVNRQADEQQGTGLGLAIVRKFIHLHGGDISVKSDEGAGTTFHFTFPGPPQEAIGTDGTGQNACSAAKPVKQARFQKQP